MLTLALQINQPIIADNIHSTNILDFTKYMQQLSIKTLVLGNTMWLRIKLMHAILTSMTIIPASTGQERHRQEGQLTRSEPKKLASKAVRQWSL